MKKLLLSALLVSGFAASAQVTVFEDGFETYDDFAITGFGGWLTLDLDGLATYIGGLPEGATEAWPNANDPQAWMVFNPAAAGVTNSTDACSSSGDENRNFDPHSGSKYAGSWAGVPAGGISANNDWLVSPPISLGTSNNNVEFWVKQLSSCYGTERFRVGVYTGTGVPTAESDFTLVSGVAAVTATTNWVLKTYSLNAYSNQTIRIGIKNQSADAYFLMVDDFKVTSSNLSVSEAFSSKFTVYPNPAAGQVFLSNAEGISISSINLTDLNGRVVQTVNLDGATQASIDLSSLSAGIYMMNISSDQGKAVKKIVRQ